MAKIITKREDLHKILEEIPLGTNLGICSAEFRRSIITHLDPGIGHYYLLTKLASICPYTIMTAFYTEPSTEESTFKEFVDIATSFSKNLPCDYFYVEEEQYKIPYSYLDINTMIHSEDFKWLLKNTDLFSNLPDNPMRAKHYIHARLAYTNTKLLDRGNRALLSYLDFIKRLNFIYAKGNKDIIDGYHIYTNDQNINKYPLFNKAYHPLFLTIKHLGRHLFPVFYWDDGSMATRRHFAGYRDGHVFNYLNRFIDTNVSSIDDVEKVVSTVVRPKDNNYYLILNLDGKKATTEDLRNRKVILVVYSIEDEDPNKWSSNQYKYEGEVLWIGFKNNEIFDLLEGCQFKECLDNSIDKKLLDNILEERKKLVHITEVVSSSKKLLYNHFNYIRESK